MAYSEYSKAGDLGPGVAWLAALGIGAAVLPARRAARLNILEALQYE